MDGVLDSGSAASEDAYDPKSIDTRINHGSKRKASGAGQIHQVVTVVAFLGQRNEEKSIIACHESLGLMEHYSGWKTKNTDTSASIASSNSTKVVRHRWRTRSRLRTYRLHSQRTHTQPHLKGLHSFVQTTSSALRRVETLTSCFQTGQASEGAWYVLVPWLKVVGLKLASLTHAWIQILKRLKSSY